RAYQSHLSSRCRFSRIAARRAEKGSALVGVAALELLLQGEELGEGGVRIRRLFAPLRAAILALFAAMLRARPLAVVLAARLCPIAARHTPALVGFARAAIGARVRPRRRVRPALLARRSVLVTSDAGGIGARAAPL